ncbi:MAG: potassium-transporting ATPase subunit KdpA, partial [Rikenellaceae bacterium]
NFWVYLVRSVTRILLPLSTVLALLLIFDGTPMTLEGKQTITTLEGSQQTISQGPVAAVVAIKQLGTNGGGFFGANSSHPLENPTYFTNMVECISIMLIPMAMIWALGFYLKKRKFAICIFSVMLTAYLVGVFISVNQEMGGNHNIEQMGIAQNMGSMEGKETRFGSAATALWAMTTTATSNGSVNGMHDSVTPITGALAMLNMQINCWFGGVGVGFMNYYIFIIIAVFLSGLMVGRTPEFMGKKIEAREMKIAIIITLLHPFLILCSTALSSYIAHSNPVIAAAWLNNPSFHGLSEMLYEFTSSAANNGSGFEGLSDNTPFWNISTGVVMIISRYMPIIGQVAIVGLLAQKKYIPTSAGTLQTDTVTFSVMTFIVIFIIAALAFFPVLTLGPIAEFLTIN